MREYFCRFCFLLMVIFAVCLTLPSKVFAQSNGELKPNPIAEAWVLEQVKVGNIADLENRFPHEEERVLSAAFLESLLLTPSENITRYGIHIEHATFIEPLELGHIEVQYEVWLGHCEFKNKVDLSESYFHEDLTFNGSIFGGDVDFNELYVGRDLTVDSAKFANRVNFRYTEVGNNFYATDAQFNNTEQTADFGQMKVGNSILLRKAVFAGPVDFRYLDLGNNFEADDARFNHAEQEAIFGNMKVGNTVFLNRAVFAGPVNFQSTDVGNSFRAVYAKFNNTEQTAYFGNMKVGEVMSLNRAIFEGPVDFEYMDIGNTFTANDAQFKNTEKTAYFGNMKVGSYIFLQKAVFAGPVDFRYAEVSINFEADGAQFKNTEKTAYFGQMKVGYKVFLTRAIFEGPVNFEYMDVGNTFTANDAQFKKEQTAYFGNMKVGAAMLLDRAIFEGPVDFRFVVVGNNFDADGAQFSYDGALLNENGERIVNDFGLMKVGGSILIRGATFAGPVDFRYVEVDTNFELNDTQFKGQNQNIFLYHIKVGDAIFLLRTFFAGPTSFLNAECSILHIEKVWPLKSKVDLTGMTYKSVEAFSDGKDAWEELISLVDQSPFNPQTYKALETFFENHGYPERADEVFIHYKLRERREALDSNLAKGWNFFLEYFILYGRFPALALLWSILIIAIGYVFFRKRDWMIESSKKYASEGKNSTSDQDVRAYYPFWYSLDLFIAPVDLGFASKWEPTPNRKAAFIYSRIQMLLGWILIPIALLALAGVIK